MVVNIYKFAKTNIPFSSHFSSILSGTNTTWHWTAVFNHIVSTVLPLEGVTIYFPSFYYDMNGADVTTPYLLREALVIPADKLINIVGDDVGSHSVLKFVGNITLETGISVNADNCSIKRISIHGNNIVNNGIAIAANNVSIYDTEVHDCKKSGIRIVQGSSWYMNAVYAYQNADTGFFIAGTQGVGIALNAFNNLGKGHIVDNGGFNTFIGCHVIDTLNPGINPYHINTPDTLLVGCYYQIDGTITPTLAKNSMWWGGQITNGLRGAGTIFNRNTFYNQADTTDIDAVRQGGMRFENIHEASNDTSFTAGGSPAGSIFEFTGNDDNIVLMLALMNGDITDLPDFLFSYEIWKKVLEFVAKQLPLHAQIMDINLNLKKLKAAATNSTIDKKEEEAMKAQIIAIQSTTQYAQEARIVSAKIAIYTNYLTIKEGIKRLNATLETATDPSFIKDIKQQITTLQADLANEEQQLLLFIVTISGKWRLKYRPNLATTNPNYYYRNWYRLVYDLTIFGIDVEDAFLTGLAFSSINSDKTQEQSGMIAFPNGYYVGIQDIGNGRYPIRIQESATMPVSTYGDKIGDRFFNTAPALSGEQNCIGWICTNDGWKKFGEILP